MVTNNIAIPVHDTVDIQTQGPRDRGASSSPLGDLSSSFQDMLYKNLRMDVKAVKASVDPPRPKAQDPASPKEPSEVVDASSERDGLDDDPRLDADRAGGDSEAAPSHRHDADDPKPESSDLTEGRADPNKFVAGDDQGSGEPDETYAAAPSDPSRGADPDAGNTSATGIATHAPGDAGETPDEPVDLIMPRAPGREAPLPQATMGHRGEAASEPTTPDALVKTGATARQAGELAKSLPAGEDVKINVAVTKAADTLLSQPASSLAAAAMLNGQKGAVRPGQGQPPIGASAKAGLTAASPNQGQATAAVAPAAHPTGGQSGSADLQRQMGQQGNQTAMAGAQSRSGGTPAPTSAGTFAEVAGLATTSATQAGQRVGQAQTATADRPAAPQPPVTEQISVQISKALKAGVDRIDIQLRPKSLGRLEVRLELSGDGRVSATVTADNRETLELLKTDARGLEKALDDAGLKADSNSLSFNLRGQDSRSPGEQLSRANQPNGVHPDPEAGTDDHGLVRTLGDYSRGGISADGHIDIET